MRGIGANNQKKFEALLVEDLIRLKDAPFILFEAESKRIGKATLPQFMIEKKEQGIQLFIDMPVEERVRHILEDYSPWEHQAECIEAFRKIKLRLHTPIAAKIDDDLNAGDFSSAVRLLLEHYYDPRYQHTADQYPQNRMIRIKAETAEDAADQIIGILQEKRKMPI